MVSVEADGVVLQAEIAGAGSPVLLVHGTSVPMWGELVERLAKNAQVIAYERRSFGASTHPPLADLTTHAKDAIAVLERCAKEPAVLVGWSIGGVVALEVATLRPDLVRGLVLLEPPLHAKRHPTFPMVRGILTAKLFSAVGNPRRGVVGFYSWAFHRRTGPNDLERLSATERERLLAAAPAIARELDGGTGEHLGLEQLAKIACPVTVVVGDESRHEFHGSAQRIVDIVASAQLVRATGTGHVIPIDRADVVETSVLETLERTVSSDAA